MKIFFSYRLMSFQNNISEKIFFFIIIFYVLLFWMTWHHTFFLFHIPRQNIIFNSLMYKNQISEKYIINYNYLNFRLTEKWTICWVPLYNHTFIPLTKTLNTLYLIKLVWSLIIVDKNNLNTTLVQIWNKKCMVYI